MSSTHRAKTPEAHRTGDEIKETQAPVVGVCIPAQGQNELLPASHETPPIGNLLQGNPPLPKSVLDLPDEVKKNIIGYEDMELDEMLLRIINSFNAVVAVDRLIMYLYTTYQKSPPRSKVLARLRELDDKGYIQKVNGVRSSYIRKPE